MNAILPIGERDSVYGLSADLLLEVRDRVASGHSDRGLARLEELERAVAVGSWD